MSDMKRKYQALLLSKQTHPYARWVAMGHADVSPACQSLDKQVFGLDDQRLKGLVAAHASCGCRLAPQRSA
jgi:hypothetical protein